MQKKIKILFTMLILLLVFVHFSYATDIDPDALTSSFNNTTNSLDSTNTTNSTNNNTATNSTSNTVKSNTNSTYSTPTVTSSSSLPEADLGFSNILNIILIVVGVLLFFLGIAILIRLK